jgi:hypothetical protein
MLSDRMHQHDGNTYVFPLASGPTGRVSSQDVAGFVQTWTFNCKQPAVSMQVSHQDKIQDIPILPLGDINGGEISDGIGPDLLLELFNI